MKHIENCTLVDDSFQTTQYTKVINLPDILFIELSFNPGTLSIEHFIDKTLINILHNYI